MLHEAETSGWSPDVFEKAIRLLALLELIDRHPFLKGKLALKGGTALNLFHLDTPRLSVDIDLNFVGSLDLQELSAQRPETERAVTAIAHSEGYTVSSSADSHAGRKLYLQYINFSGNRDRVEVDINYMFRVPLQPLSRQRPRVLMPGMDISFPLVGWFELLAGKWLAAIDRVASRDVYDLAQLHPCEAANDPAFRATVVGLSAILPHPLHTYGMNRFARIDRRTAETELSPFLRAGTSFDHDEILTNANQFLSRVLELTEQERLYVDGIARGEIRSELLLPSNSAFCERLKKHPAVRWKIKNVLSHIER